MLLQMHNQLEGHFRTLSLDRVTLGYPVYAFEHGLADEQLRSVRTALCNDLFQSKRLKREHWLLWTVVAAEIGYAYDGDEYWYSFEHEIQGWSDFGSREAVRSWFQDFTRHFNGFQPTGRWAEHFSIIAWPITHSILPRYLQAQFAHHLYELRYELATRNRASALELGQLLGQRYHGVSSRFASFLQQTALTARLVLALRDEDVLSTVTPIYRPTLARILSDLESKGSSKSYLRDTRRVLRDVRTRTQAGLAGASTRSAPSGPPNYDTPAILAGLKLVAHRAPDDSWRIGVALPDFDKLLASCGFTTAALAKTRFQFVDRPETWAPGLGLLSYSNTNHALSMLPSDLDKPIICFRSAPNEMKQFEAHLKILSRSPWLLRVHSDGIARQVLGNHVRAGEEYVVASAASVNPELVQALSLDFADSRTAGIYIYPLHVPDIVSPQFVQALRKLSLGYALRARVRPFGLVPRWDEANGCPVWLVSEEILLYLSADFQVTEFSLSLNGQRRTCLPLGNRQDAIVSLGFLLPGRHAIEISPTAAAGALRLIVPETVAFEVRAPKPWRSDTTARTGMRVALHPPDATFGDLVERRASLAVHGPEGRTATMEARLYDVSGHLTESAEIGRIEVPSRERDVARAVEKLTGEPLSEIIQSSSRIDLAFTVDELGVATVSFSHKVLPLRWKLTADGGRYTMRLINEKDAGASVSVSRYDLGVPDKKVDVLLKEALQGATVDQPGALFVAHNDGKIFPALASVGPGGRLNDFSQLIPRIVLDTPGESARSITRLLAVLRIWRSGHPLGTLAAIRKMAVLEVVKTRIEQLACGNYWAEKAESCRNNRGPLEKLQAVVGGSPGFASRMRTTEWKWDRDPAHACSEFFRFAKTYQICDDRTTSDLAMCLAFSPSNIKLNDPKKAADAFGELGKLPILARGAYFAKLVSDLRFAQPQRDTDAAI